MNSAPYPSDTRAKGWRFELDYERINQSDTWALASSDLRPWLLMLWVTSWQQVPCGSLPKEDQYIAARIGMPMKTFEKAKETIMRGWWPADDGRLYHPVVTEMVHELITARGTSKTRQKTFRNKTLHVRVRDGGACVYCGARAYLSLDHLLPLSRGGTGEDTNLVTACRSCNSRKGARTPDEARMAFINEGARALWLDIADEVRNALPTRTFPHKGATTVQLPAERAPEPEPEPEDKTKAIQKTALRAENTARGARLPPEWRLPDDWARWAKAERPDLDPQAVSETFADFWRAKPGAGGLKLDWQATWRNWVRAQRAPAPARQNGQVAPNRQEALEARNRAVGEAWLRETQDQGLTIVELK